MTTSAAVHNRPTTPTRWAADLDAGASPAASNVVALACDVPRQCDGGRADRHGLSRGIAVDPSATAVTASVSAAHDQSAPDEYAHLVPLLCRYARLAPDDPQRKPLRDQLISGYLPVAEHLARRFAGRGEPLEDLLIDHRETLRPLLAELAPRERMILALRFFHGLSQMQIAEQVGISQMHVSRTLRKTLTFLQQRMTDETGF